MIIIKTPEEIEIIREGGKNLATVLYAVKEIIKPGISTKDLDIYAEKLIREMRDTPAFLNYRPSGALTPFPATLCVSVNDEVVHGIPKKNRILKNKKVGLIRPVLSGGAPSRHHCPWSRGHGRA